MIAARNEAASVDSLTSALESLDYPAERLFTVLVDDCSSDETPTLLAAWAAGRPRTETLPLRSHVGLHHAQVRGMALDDGELVVLCDADLRPRPDVLRRLAEAFDDERVGAAAAFIAPANAGETAVSRYAALESWVNQLVTSAGKDRLNLNPPTNGCSAYRRAALEQIGSFPADPGADARASVALTRAGWRTRFAPAAIGDNAVVHDWAGYWHQHVRWARNLFASASSNGSASAAAGLAPRIEAWMFSAGYADRLVLLAALPLLATGRMRLHYPAVYLATVSGEIWVALSKAGAGRDGHRYLLSAAIVFPVDVAASVAAVIAHLRARPRSWRHPRGDASDPAPRRGVHRVPPRRVRRG